MKSLALFPLALALSSVALASDRAAVSIEDRPMFIGRDFAVGKKEGVRRDVAIDDGLWYLHQRNAGQRTPIDFNVEWGFSELFARFLNQTFDAPGQRSQLAKLTVQPEKGDKYTVLFNPKEYTVRMPAVGPRGVKGSYLGLSCRTKGTIKDVNADNISLPSPPDWADKPVEIAIDEDGVHRTVKPFGMSRVEVSTIFLPGAPKQPSRAVTAIQPFTVDVVGEDAMFFRKWHQETQRYNGLDGDDDGIINEDDEDCDSLEVEKRCIVRYFANTTTGIAMGMAGLGILSFDEVRPGVFRVTLYAERCRWATDPYAEDML